MMPPARPSALMRPAFAVVLNVLTVLPDVVVSLMVNAVPSVPATGMLAPMTPPTQSVPLISVTFISAAGRAGARFRPIIPPTALPPTTSPLTVSSEVLSFVIFAVASLQPTRPPTKSLPQMTAPICTVVAFLSHVSTAFLPLRPTRPPT